MLKWAKGYPKGVPLLLINTLMMSLGFFALIPYLSLHLTQSLLWTPLLAGVLLMVRQFSQQGLAFFTGLIADQVGYKTMITLGLFVRGIGFLLFAVFEQPAGIFLAAIITGIGGAIFEPTSNAAISYLTPVKQRGEMYSIKKIMANIGIALAAIVSAILIQFDFVYIAIVCGGIFIFISILTFIRMPAISTEIEMVPLKQMGSTVLKDRHFVFFTAITIGFYFMFMQMFLTIPLRATEISEHPEAISVVFLLLAVMIICFQYPVNRYMAKYNILISIKLGLGLMGVGLVVLGTANSLTVFLIGFMFFAAGVMMTEPSIFDFISRLSKPTLMASYFGFASLAMAFGGGLSQGLGGFLLQFGASIGFPSLLWWVAGAVSLTSITGLVMLEKQMSKNPANLEQDQVALDG